MFFPALYNKFPKLPKAPKILPGKFLNQSNIEFIAFDNVFLIVSQTPPKNETSPSHIPVKNPAILFHIFIKNAAIVPKIF